MKVTKEWICKIMSKKDRFFNPEYVDSYITEIDGREYFACDEFDHLTLDGSGEYFTCVGVRIDDEFVNGFAPGYTLYFKAEPIDEEFDEYEAAPDPYEAVPDWWQISEDGRISY